MSSMPGLKYRDSNDCFDPYRWWVCNYNGQKYEGCCNVDPCRSIIGCPAPNQQPTTIQSTSTTPSLSPGGTSSETAISSDSVAAQSPSRTATSPNAGVTATTAASQTPASQPLQANNLSLPIGAMVGIVVGSFFMAVFLGIWLCMWWGKRQRRKDEARVTAAGNLPSRSGSQKRGTAADGLAPIRPTSEQARLPEEAPAAYVPDVLRPGMGRYIRDSQTTQSSGRPHSALISPITPTSMMAHDPTQQHSELDSTPIPELDSIPHQSGVARLVSPMQVRDKNWPIRGDGPFATANPAPQMTQEPIDRPRATLNSTKFERASGTYANSWTRFHNIQV